MEKYNWSDFLTKVNDTLLKDIDTLRLINNPESLFNSPATSQQIQEKEKKLGIQLPASYKAFLQVSNGFKMLSQFFWNILPVEEIQWLKDCEPGLIEAYMNPFPDGAYGYVSNEEYFVYGDEQRTVNIRPEYLQSCLSISGWGDSSLILLNPEIKFGDEWEAWAFANWYPGACRFKSFWDLANDEFKGYIDLRNNS